MYWKLQHFSAKKSAAARGGFVLNIEAEGMYNALSSACQSQSFLLLPRSGVIVAWGWLLIAAFCIRSSGLTKQLVLDSLSDVLFILDEVWW